MKKLITLIICILLIGVSYYKHDEILNYTLKYFNSTPKIELASKNNYYKNYNFNYIKNSKDFIPYNFQDLLDIFYSILNSGYEKFTFYCPREYLDCISDIEYISNPDNIDTLTNIGNYVSPFNNFISMKVLYDTAGEITIEVSYLYTPDEIDKINKKLDEIAPTIIKEDMTTEDIIYAWHDYIINTTKYDQAYEEELKTNSTTHKSNKAIGPLFEGYGICSGYTDTMAIILDRLNLENFKVASKSHVWNAVKINDEWKHLDLTWDDPVSKDPSKDNLLHQFFLIDTKTLEEFDIKDHEFDKSIYTELKKES